MKDDKMGDDRKGRRKRGGKWGGIDTRGENLEKKWKMERNQKRSQNRGL
jgi:hypothetical protein